MLPLWRVGHLKPFEPRVAACAARPRGHRGPVRCSPRAGGRPSPASLPCSKGWRSPRGRSRPGSCSRSAPWWLGRRVFRGYRDRRMARTWAHRPRSRL